MQENLRLLGALASGEPVYDRPCSHLHASVAGLLPEAFARISSGGAQFLAHEVDFGRIVGETTCVPTGEGDEVVWAQRPGRRGMTRFVKNRDPEPASTVVLILKRDRFEPYYVLVTAFVGRQGGLEPWDPRACKEDRKFWEGHALVYGSEPILPETETGVCPW